ncbi:MAG TPA: hypothetical protein VF945_21105, partial [Polyangia bacterium]
TALRAGLAHLDGDDAAAATLLGEAAAGFDEHEMRMHAAVMRARRGALVGGEAGQADRDAARAWMQAQAVANPERFLRVLSPAFYEKCNRRSGEREIEQERPFS